MSCDPKLVSIFINPLAFTLVDEPWRSAFGKEATAEDWLKFACGPSHGDIGSIKSRYLEISQEEDKRLFAVPADQHFLSRSIWPLRFAKVAYALGNYLATISPCGVAAEMTTMLLYELHKMRLGETTRDDDAQVQTLKGCLNDAACKSSMYLVQSATMR